MTNTLNGGAAASGGCRIGILVRMSVDGGRTVMDPADYARFFAQEAHLRAAVEHAGLTLASLGYITDGRVQYEVRAVAEPTGQAPDERRAAVRTTLASLVTRAQRAESDTGASPDGGVTPSVTSGAQVDPGVATGAQLEAPSPVPERSTGNNTGSSAPDDAETSKPTPAPPVADPIQDGQLRKDVKLGPPTVTIDGDDVAWASALDHTTVDAVNFDRSITCELGRPERHIIDRHNTRYRSADPHPNQDIREGSILEVDGVKSEKVLIATVSSQVELGLDEDDEDD